MAVNTTGARLLEKAGSLPRFLTRECDSLTPESVKATAERLGMADLPVWDVATQHIEQLKTAFRSYPETLQKAEYGHIVRLKRMSSAAKAI